MLPTFLYELIMRCHHGESLYYVYTYKTLQCYHNIVMIGTRTSPAKSTGYEMQIITVGLSKWLGDSFGVLSEHE